MSRRFPMFAELGDLLKSQNKALEIYQAQVLSNIQNNDFTDEYKAKNKTSIDNDYLIKKQERYVIAKELLAKQIEKFNSEIIDTDFLVKAKTLGNVMPNLALTEFLENNRGNFRTAQALFEIYEGNPQKQHIINDFRLRIERVGRTPQYLDVETYAHDLAITLDNYFLGSQKLPSTIDGYKGNLSYNQVISQLNAGQTSEGNNPIELDQSAVMSVNGTDSRLAEPQTPSNFNFFK